MKKVGNIHPRTLFLLQLADSFVIIVGGTVCYFLHPFNDRYPEYFGAMSIAVLAMSYFGVNFKAYSNEMFVSRAPRVRETVKAWISAWAASIALAVLFKLTDHFSRIWMVSFLVSATMLLIIWRIYWRRIFSLFDPANTVSTPTAIYGLCENGEVMARLLSADPDSNVAVRGFFDDRLQHRESRLTEIPYLGSTDELISAIRANQIRMVLVALPIFAHERIGMLLDKLANTPVDIRFLAVPPVEMVKKFESERISGLWFVSHTAHRIDEWRETSKIIQDRLIGMALLLFSLPLIAFIAVAIKLDSQGPVLFRQRRKGYNDEVFWLYKFRSLEHAQTDESADRLVGPGDARVTRIGRFLRRSSLDELPQLFNVIRGDMSLVGPRPHALGAKAAGIYYEEAVKDYARRHNVKPGLTGLAQVSGLRGETDTKEKILKRVEYDLIYISRWSMWLDWKILFRTLPAIIKGDGAH